MRRRLIILLYLFLIFSCDNLEKNKKMDVSFEIMYVHNDWYAVGYTEDTASLWAHPEWVGEIRNNLVKVDANIVLLFNSKNNTPAFQEKSLDVREGNFLEEYFFYGRDSIFYSNDSNIVCVYRKSVRNRKEKFCYGGQNEDRTFKQCK